MLMNVLRAQEFVQTVSVSTQMGLFAVNVQWVTTLITLECAVWVSAELVPHFTLVRFFSFLYSAKGLSGTLGGSGIYKAKISSHTAFSSPILHFPATWVYLKMERVAQSLPSTRYTNSDVSRALQLPKPLTGKEVYFTLWLSTSALLAEDHIPPWVCDFFSFFRASTAVWKFRAFHTWPSGFSALRKGWPAMTKGGGCKSHVCPAQIWDTCEGQMDFRGHIFIKLSTFLSFFRYWWMFNWQPMWKWDVHQRYWEFRMQLQWGLWARAHDELWRQVILYYYFFLI